MLKFAKAKDFQTVHVIFFSRQLIKVENSILGKQFQLFKNDMQLKRKQTYDCSKKILEIVNFQQCKDHIYETIVI